ncbi:hypothetical protein [Azospirillum rugosum]|uniref:Uncharacterized protein n=1 Tax=Azospirillum rugosum TaxID=416170 RepID=A0ABS4SRA9_9PROT|nr:hypothetical protein [Azospirillum rugosum]MBP2295089.1 hypothetical protein [Azospirillum rugosum]MDQ0528463.1 hypothetical protein [Azospirillum rugosum]
MRTIVALLPGRRSEFPDEVRVGPQARRPDGACASAADPGDLLRNVAEARRTRAVRALRPSSAGGALDGVLGMLLDTPNGGPALETLRADEDGFARTEAPPLAPASGRSAPTGRSRRPPPRSLPERREREHFEAIVGEMRDRIRKLNFRDSCTASQLVAACSFPLALTIVGARNGWYPPGCVASVAESVLSTLLRHRWLDTPAHSGLVDHVRTRYAAARPSADVFDHAVSDGTLWFRLFAALDRALAYPGNRRCLLRKAKLVRDTIARTVHYDGASAEYLAALGRVGKGQSHRRIAAMVIMAR